MGKLVFLDDHIPPFLQVFSILFLNVSFSTFSISLKAIYGIMDNVFVHTNVLKKSKIFDRAIKHYKEKYDHRMGRIFRSLHSGCW